MNGLHILAELHACQGERRLLQDAAALAALCRRACAGAGLEVVAEAFHQFPAAGATGALVLAESHLAIHTWPEFEAVTLDLYVCNHSQDNRAAAETAYRLLNTEFQPVHTIRRDIRRGGLEPTVPHACPPGTRQADAARVSAEPASGQGPSRCG